MLAMIEETVNVGMDSLPEDLKNRLVESTILSRAQAVMVEDCLNEILSELKEEEACK